MSIPLSSNGETIQVQEETSFVSLLERGIEHVRQGDFSDGSTCLSLAREQLSLDQERFAAALDSLLQANEDYCNAQQMLHLASRRFAEAEVAQQACLTALETLTTTLNTPLNTTPLSSRPSHPLKLLNFSSSQKTAQALQQLPDKDSIPPQTQTQTQREPFHLSFQRSERHDQLPALHIICFGHFAVWRLDQEVALCHNRNGQIILRYFMTQPDYIASTDALMGILWPEDAPDVARHKLQIAVSALRRSLNEGYSNDPGSGYILHRNQSYLLNPAVMVRTDVDEFLSLSRVDDSASQDTIIELYERACQFYTTPFLVDDLYTDWSTFKREQLSRIYLGMCHVITDYYLETGQYHEAAGWAAKILAEDCCDETAHRQLIRAYVMQGQRNEALRQYQRCKHILAEELGLAPMPETFNAIQELFSTGSFKERK